MKKRILALFLALQMVLSYAPVPSAIAAELPATVPEEVNGFVKTAAWTEVPGEADITLESDYDHYAIPETQKILFMGSMCNAHSLDMDTVKGSIESCAKYADVDVKLFDSPQEGKNNTVLYDFEITKDTNNDDIGKVIKSKNASLKEGHHASLYDFAAAIANTDMSKYAHIVLEFDGLRMGMFTKTINNDMRADLLAAAKKLVSFYEQGKVSWIICDKDTGFTENTIGYTTSSSSTRVNIKPATVRMFNDCYINASDLRRDNQSYNFYQAGIYDALALVAPEDWLNSARTARKDYPSDYKGFVNEDNLPTYFARTAEGADQIWVNYGNAAAVSGFIEETMEGHDFNKVLVVDEVKEGFIITGVECQYWDATKEEFTALPTPDEAADKYYTLDEEIDTDRKVIGTFKLDAIKTDFSTPHIRMLVHIVADPANDPFTGDTDGKVETNKSAKAEYYYENDKLLDTKTATSPTLTGVKITYVSANTNMGTVSSAAEWVAPNATSAVGSTATPKTGYEFDHWESAKTSDVKTAKIAPEPTKEIKSDPAEYIYEDITYTAVFAPIEYTVTFDTYGGDPLTIDDQKVNYNEKATKPADDPTKAGYDFKEWVDKDDAKKTPWNFDDKVTGDLNLLATYTPRDDTKYIVKYFYEDSDGTYPAEPETVSAQREGTTDTQVKINDDDKAPAKHFAADSIKAGYKFVLDERDAYKVDWADETLNGDGSTVLKVYFRRTYDVTFNANGGTPTPATQTLFYDGEATKPATDPVKTGYDFVRWEDSAGEEWRFKVKTVTEDIELTAAYTPATDVEYKVEYYYQNSDGSFSDVPDKYVTRHNGTTGSNIAVTNDDKTPYAPLTKPGAYVLNSAKNANWEKVVEADGSTVLKVYFNRAFVVEFDPNGGSPKPESEVVFSGEPAVRPADPEKEGYEFDRWVNPEGKTWDFANDKVTGNITLKAEYIPKTDTPYKVEFYYENPNGTYSATPIFTDDRVGTTGEIAEVTGADKTPIDAPAGEFKLDEADEYDDAWAVKIAPDGSTVLKVYFKQLYTVTYLPGTRGTFAPDVHEGLIYGENTPALAEEYTTEDGEPEGEDGYEFIGWTPEVTDNVTKSVTYTATWMPSFDVSYIVRHIGQDLDGNYKVVLDKEINKGGITGTTATATPGNFDGFTYNPTKSAKTISGEIAGDGSLVLKVYYDRDKIPYTIHYLEEGTETPLADDFVSEPVFYGSTIATTPENIEFYTVIGDPQTIAALSEDNDEITYYYKKNVFTVTYTDGVEGKTIFDDVVYSDVEVNTNTPSFDPEDKTVIPKRKNYQFMGWSPEVADKVTEDVTYVAQWLKLFDVTYEYTGYVPEGAGEIPATQRYVKGANVIVDPDPITPAGYVFAGWTTDSATIEDGTFTMPKGNVKLIGSFIPCEDTPYKVEFYYQNPDGTYSEEATDDEVRTGTTDTTVCITDEDKIPTEAAIGAFVVDDTQNEAWEANLAGDGSTVLKVYFKRQYTVTYQKGTHGTFDDDIHEGLNYGIDTPGLNGEYIDDGAPVGEPGWVFTGWAPEVADTVTADATYVATWMPSYDVKYLVRHIGQDLEGNYTILFDKENHKDGITGQTVTALPREYEGFTYNETKSTKKISGVVTGDGSLVLKVFYDRNMVPYTIRYLEAGTENPLAEEVTGEQFFGSKLETEPIEIFNYTITPETDFNQTIEELQTEGNVITYYYTENLYKVKYVDGVPGEEIFSNVVYKKLKLNSRTPWFNPDDKDAVPEREGYRFMGWDKKVTKRVEGDATYKAQWAKLYDVTYEYVGNVPDGAGILPEDAQYIEGENVVLAEAPVVPAGYTFGGWTTEDATITEDAFTMPAADVVVKGSFIPNDDTEYMVEYYYQDDFGKYPAVPFAQTTRYGVTDTVATITTDKDKIPAAIPMKVYAIDEAHKEAWQEEIAGDGSTVLKVYFKQQYTVTYLPGSQGAFMPDAHVGLSYGDYTPVLSPYCMLGIAPKGNPGYVFAGWSPVVAPSVTHNAIYTARWIPCTDIKYTIQHIGQDLDGKYSMLLDIENNADGVTGTIVTATPGTFEGFEYNKDMSAATISGTIKADGSLVLTIYYDRIQVPYTIHYYLKDTKTALADDVTGTGMFGSMLVTSPKEIEGYTIDSDSDLNQRIDALALTGNEIIYYYLPPAVRSMELTKAVAGTPENGSTFVNGEKVKYVITLRNTGNVPLCNIVVSDPLTGDEWKVDCLPAGESKMFETKHSVSYAEAKAGTLTNKATAITKPVCGIDQIKAEAEVTCKTTVSETVKTGDYINEAGWIMLAALSCVCAISLFVVKRKFW